MKVDVDMAVLAFRNGKGAPVPFFDGINIWRSFHVIPQ